jgi:hypothetical protein
MAPRLERWRVVEAHARDGDSMGGAQGMFVQMICAG